MATDGKRHCIVAPKYHEYKYCGRCGRYNSNETWRNMFCSENCRDFYKIIEKFVGQKISRESALTNLKKLEYIPESKVQPLLAKRLREIGYY